SVVQPLDPDSRRKDAGGVYRIHLGFHALDSWHALLAAAHEHDPLDHIVIRVMPGDPEARRMLDANIRNVSDDDRNAAVGADHGLAYVFHRVDQPDAAHNR